MRGGPREWEANDLSRMGSQAFHGQLHSPSIRWTFTTENGPCHSSGSFQGRCGMNMEVRESFREVKGGRDAGRDAPATVCRETRQPQFEHRTSNAQHRTSEGRVVLPFNHQPSPSSLGRRDRSQGWSDFFFRAHSQMTTMCQPDWRSAVSWR